MSKFQIEYEHYCPNCDSAYLCIEPEIQAFAECSCYCVWCEVNQELDSIVPTCEQLLEWMAEDEQVSHRS